MNIHHDGAVQPSLHPSPAPAPEPEAAPEPAQAAEEPIEHEPKLRHARQAFVGELGKRGDPR